MSSAGSLNPAPGSGAVGVDAGTTPSANAVRRVPVPRKRGGAETGGREPVRQEVLLAVAMVGVLGVMVLPLPSVALDLLLSLSVSLALLVYLFSLHIERPLDFSAFPSVLLMVTLLRLSLNVASTRLILLKGSEGEAAAGAVIRSFGQFVVGGNTVVGIIVFLILVVINFVVITKGSGRIAEVAARFTLDSMPGKQMAIDADLGAGLITENDARTRRARIEQEADFFGAMDGASKFVRGDAIAGLVITAVNIVGGLIVGMAQHNMSFGGAAATYTQLTVGDGLVSQIPALLTSIAAGLVTTRAAAGGSLGEATRRQLFGSKRPLLIAASVLGILAMVPGMPHFAFGALAVLLGVIGLRVKEEVPEEEEAAVAPAGEDRSQLEGMLPLDLLEIEVGYELVGLVDLERDGSLLRRITAVRKQIAQEFGLLIPPIHMRDNLRLRPGGYRVLLSGNEIGKGELRPDHLLAMNPAGGEITVRGEPTKEPAFGLPARWIEQREREAAEMAGLTVVDASTVAATHLGELLTSHAFELLGRREVQELLDIHARDHQRLIEEVVPNQITLTQLVKVLRSLLKERISIRDFRGVLECLADYGADIKEPEQLTELVRQRLGRQITARYVTSDGRLPALVLSPDVEQAFRRLQGSATGLVEPGEIQQLLRSFEDTTRAMRTAGELPVILTAADVRRSVSTFANRHLEGMPVLSYRELDPGVEIQTLGVVGEPLRAQTG